MELHEDYSDEGAFGFDLACGESRDKFSTASGKREPNRPDPPVGPVVFSADWS